MAVDRRTAAVAVLGLLAVSALVLSAATLTDAAESEGDGGWINLGPDENAAGDIFSGTIDLPIPSQYLDELWTLLAAVSVLLLLSSLIVLDPDEIIRIVAGLLVTLAGGAIIGLLMGTIGMDESLISINGTVTNGTGLSLPTGESASPSSGALSPYLLGAGAFVVLIAVGLLFARSGDEDALDALGEDKDEPGGDTERLVSLGEAAGRAAAGIAASNVETSNAVYAAWLEMTDALDVTDPETTTPGEFAEAAVEAGMEPEHVDELTRLFEDVRYGDAPVSPARAERAEAALSHIEAAYAGDGA
mgnify:CR=1 FL=1